MANAVAERVALVVTLERCVYASPDGDRPYAVWEVAGDKGVFRAVGELDPEQWGDQGDTVRLVGQWVDHPRFGRQFRADSVQPYVPRDVAGIVRWLEEQPGIGPATATKVVEHLGPDDPLGRIAANPGLLKPLKLSSKQRKAVVKAAQHFQQDRHKEAVLEWCFRYGLGPWQAGTVFEVFGPEAPSILSESPWELAWLPRFGFLMADGLAQQLGANPLSPARLKAALAYVLEKAAEEEGHVFLPREEWTQRALQALRETAKSRGYGRGQEAAIEEALPQAAEALAAEGEEDETRVVIDGGRVYLEWLWKAERMVREWVAARAGAAGICSVEEAHELAALDEVRGPLDDVQLEAVVRALSSGAMILTGGPGTGKTTVTRSILAALKKKLGKRFKPLLCAPTGRAAKRLAEVTGLPAQTIHRLLEYHPDLGFLRNAREPLDGSFLIADEMSMADIGLFAALVDAIPPDMPVLFVGDADQLPPVGPGAPFHEIIARELLPVARLSRIYRQDAGGPIARAARAVHDGQVPPLQAGTRHYGIRIFPRAPFNLPAPERERRGRETRERMAEAVVASVEQLLRDGWRSDDIQVLTPMKRGAVGTEELNNRLRPVLNRAVRDPVKDVFQTASGREIWLGDRVIQTINDYDLGVFNGEIGKVVAVGVPVKVPRLGERPGIVVEFEDGDGIKQVQYWAGNLKALQLAYATTVHKAQGSEFPAVVFVLAWDAYRMLSRPLLYTAISRARELLWVFAEARTLEKAVATARDTERYQRLPPDQVISR